MNRGLYPRPLRAAWSSFLLAALVACSAAPAPDHPGEEPPVDAGAALDVFAPPPGADAGEGAAGDAGQDAWDGDTCALSTLPILANSVEEDFNIPVTKDGQAAAFLIDTGSPLTYLWLPLPDAGAPDDAAAPDAGGGSGTTEVPDAGSVSVGCETATLPGLPQFGETPVDGRSVVGTIGDDWLLAGPTFLDLQGSEIVFHASGQPFTQAQGWPSMALSRPYGYVRVEGVSFDGNPVKLLLDTGSPDCLWLGEQPAPGDVEITGVDVEGQPVIMYESHVTLTIGSLTKVVPVYKVPSFPYFQPLATATGVAGLFGVSAFADGVVFDTDAQLVRVAP